MYVSSLRKTFRSVSRPDTKIEIRGLSDDGVPSGEDIYWHNHPRINADFVELAKRLRPREFDGIIIGDVGMVGAKYALRELLDIPVIHAGESGLSLTQLLGTRFMMLTYDEKIAAWLLRVLREHDLERRCVSIRVVDVDVGKVISGRYVKMIYGRMTKEAKDSIAKDRAEVIFVASAGFAGLADHLRKRVNAPVVDPVEAAVKIAEMLVDLKKTKNLYHSKVSTWRYP